MLTDYIDAMVLTYSAINFNNTFNFADESERKLQYFTSLQTAFYSIAAGEALIRVTMF